jgi:tetratricopeptide (TPR) repeat protein
VFRNREFELDLRRMIRQRQVVGVVGSGVSVATTLKAPRWRELIRSGIEHCRTLGESDAWCTTVGKKLELESLETLLSAAEQVHKRLRRNGGGELARWLRETFEELQPKNRSVIESLATLDLPLVTTNYDDLIEKVTSRRHVCWTDSRNVTRFIRGDDQRVLHLHGHWEEPDSVVLGIRSYERVKKNKHTQAVMRALGMRNSLLFVGCGGKGLTDPNWHNFLTWLKRLESSSGVEHRHYLLVREKDPFQQQGRLFGLVYGKAYADLPNFLARMCSHLPVRDRREKVEQSHDYPDPGLSALEEGIGHLRRHVNLRFARKQMEKGMKTVYRFSLADMDWKHRPKIDDFLRAATHFRHFGDLLRTQRDTLAFELYQMAQDFLESAGEIPTAKSEEGKLLSSLAEFYLRFGSNKEDWTKAAQSARKSILLHRAQENSFELFQSYRILADVHLALRKPNLAKQCLNEAERFWGQCEQQKQPESRKLEGWLKLSRGDLHASQRRWSRARKEYVAARNIFDNDGDRIGIAVALAKLAVADTKLGDRPKAKEESVKAVRMIKSIPGAERLHEEIQQIG